MDYYQSHEQPQFAPITLSKTRITIDFTAIVSFSHFKNVTLKCMYRKTDVYYGNQERVCLIPFASPRTTIEHNENVQLHLRNERTNKTITHHMIGHAFLECCMGVEPETYSEIQPIHNQLFIMTGLHMGQSMLP
jgi:hypothetical protein